jgi:hypothetical protein
LRFLLAAIGRIPPLFTLGMMQSSHTDLGARTAQVSV